MIMNMFSTPVAIYQLRDYFKDFEASTQAMIEAFPKNEHSNNLFTFGSAFKELEGLINQMVELYRREAEIKDELRFFNGFFNEYLPGELNSPHAHPLVMVVAVYYLRAIPGHGDILLHDPRTAVMWKNRMEESVRGGAPLLAGYRTYERIQPETGQLLIFPGYLAHSVEPNTVVDGPTRLSIGMNLYSRTFLRQFNPNL